MHKKNWLSKKITSFEKGPIKRSLFSNGLVSLYHHMPSMQGAVIKVYFLVGSMHEKKDEYGITHLIEHLLFKENGSTRLTYELEKHGALINAYTTKDHMAFELNCNSDRQEHFLELFLELILQLAFTQAEFELEKSIIHQELCEDLDDHESQGMEYLFQKHLGPQIGHPVGGHPHGIKKMGMKKIINYYKKYFSPERMIITTASGKKFERYETIISNYMARYMSEYKRGRPSRDKYLKSWSVQKPFKVTLKRATENCYLYLAFNGPMGRSPYYYDLVILDELLCQGLTSYFYSELREKLGLIYGMGSSINTFAHKGNYVLIFNCSANNRHALKKAVLSIWHQILKNGFTKEEIDMARERVMNSILLSMDSIDVRCEYMGMAEIFGRRDFSLQAIKAKVSRVNAKRIQKMMRLMEDGKISELTILSQNE